MKTIQMDNIVLSSLSTNQLITEISERLISNLSTHLQGITRTQEQDEILTRQQAAKLLGISLPTLNEWTKEGIVQGYRISSRVRYKRSEVEQALIQIKSIKHKNQS